MITVFPVYKCHRFCSLKKKPAAKENGGECEKQLVEKHDRSSPPLAMFGGTKLLLVSMD